MSRESVLHNIRIALGRTARQGVPPLPPPYMVVPQLTRQERIDAFVSNFQALAGNAVVVRSRTALKMALAPLLNQRTAIASESPYLTDCGIQEWPGVRFGLRVRDDLKSACASVDVGITSVDFALASTGTLVMLASPMQPRLISLLPPAHVAIFPASAILTGIDELFSVLPNPAEQTSSMVLITGPSRTADIEQILVRGVHGPGEIHAVIIDE